MAVIRITDFGGLLPYREARALPPANAAVAENLFPRTPEFRPLLDVKMYEEVLGNTTFNPVTLYRMQRKSGGDYNDDPETGWLGYSTHMVHAKWPGADGGTERTTLSSATGAAAPRVINNAGADRLLGVPSPEKPTVVVTPGQYFTAEDRVALMAQVRANIISVLLANLTRAKIGATYTGDTVEGYLESGPEEGEPINLTRARVYRYDGQNGNITDRYTPGSDADVAWVRTSGYGRWMQAGATPTWMGGSGTWHLAVDYNAYGAGWKFDSSQAETDLAALDHVSSSNAAVLAAFYDRWMDPANPQNSATIDALREVVGRVEAALDSRPSGSYTDTETQAKIDAALEATANDIYNLLRTLAVTGDQY